jgi:hypothetical protein
MNSLLCWQMFELGRICARFDNEYRLARYSDEVQDVADELSGARDTGSETMALAKLRALGERVALEGGDYAVLAVWRALALVPVAR